MATKFVKGQTVRLKTVPPQGEVSALKMDEDGQFFYKFSWVDDDGVLQTRWFKEEDLVAAD